ncbi:MAG: hypothetical protein QOI21_3037 [Actinomycetota bacterium]|nr:hypothetical protein [Actinomycetota bacterium]
MEALENENPPANQDLPVGWDAIAVDARVLLGEISVFDGPPSWSLNHPPTGIEVSCMQGEWSMTVPYWSHGDEADEIVRRIYALASIVEAATGLTAYDPQLGEPMRTGDEQTVQNATGIFNQIKGFFSGTNSPS